MYRNRFHLLLLLLSCLLLAATSQAFAAAGPILQVTTDVGTPLSNGGTYTFNGIQAGYTVQSYIRIYNLGDKNNLSVSGAISSGSGNFLVITSPSIVVGPKSSGYFLVSFSASTAGAYSGTLTLSTNDPSNVQFNLSLTGTAGSYPSPMLDLEYTYPNPSARVVKNDLVDFGSVIAGAILSRNFSYANYGNAALHISNPGSIFSCPGFTLINQPVATLPSQSSNYFTVQFQQSVRGTYYCNVSIATDAPGAAPFTYTILARSQGPVLEVFDGTTQISNYGTVNLGSSPVGTPVSKVLTVVNAGDSTLNLSSLSGGGGPFTLTGFPVSGIAPGGNASFTVTFTPTANGLANTLYTFHSNDPLFPTFGFYAQGTGSGPALSVTNNAGATVANGATIDFGNTPVGTPTSQPFLINDIGSATLTVSNFTLSAPGGGYFILTAPDPSVAPGGNTGFRIRLLAGTAGTYTGTLTFNTNDPGNPTFTLHLTGTVGSTTAPKIRVTAGDGTAIPNGGSYAYPSTTLGTPVSRAFLIYNDGTANLTILNPATLVTGTGFAEGAQSQPPTTIAPGTSGQFRVNLQAQARGTFTGTVSIQSNDTTANPYTFTVSGTVN